jgi:hypothetical protein
MEFTQTEFDIMVRQLLCDDAVSFEMLCQIADKTLSHRVALWCRQDDCLRGRGYEEDLMQEIHLRLMKTTVSHFLLQSEGVNNDPQGFRGWLITVAKNLKRDFSDRVRLRDFKTRELDVLENVAAVENDDAHRIERLREAFDVAVSADVGIYKILTWMAQFVFILGTGVTKIQSNELIIETFENKTLNEMYDMILSAAEQIPWLAVTADQNKKIRAALQEKRTGNSTYGQAKYREFFMKSNGAAAPKKSISDWINRMNDGIRRRTDDDGQPSPQKRKSSARRQANEPSDS